MRGPRILIVNVNWVGDVLFSTPAIRAVRKRFPEAWIACLVPARCREVLQNNPYLDEVIVREDRTAFFSWPKAAHTVWELRKRRFDSAIFFHRSRTKVFLAALAGIPERAGYASRFRFFLTKACPPPRAPLHKTDVFLKLVECLGIPSDGRGLDFSAGPEAAVEIQDLLRAHGLVAGEPYLVAHAGGNWDLKRWPAEHFVRWAALCRKEYPWKIVLCGTAKEKNLCDRIRAAFKENEVISLCGKTSLGGLAYLLKNARLVLSNDSGPVHVAASQRAKTLVLFGPTSPSETGPVSDAASVLQKDVGCEIPCYFRSCSTRVCMEWLTPEEVFEKTKAMLTNDVPKGDVSCF